MNVRRKPPQIRIIDMSGTKEITERSSKNGQRAEILGRRRKQWDKDNEIDCSKMWRQLIETGKAAGGVGVLQVKGKFRVAELVVL